MIRRGVRIQLALFAVVSVASVLLLLFRFGGLAELINPPYLVRAHFTQSAGLFPRSEVDLLGTAVGEVRELGLDRNGDVQATLAIDNGVAIPADVTAAVADKSAIGEQYVALTPRTAGGRTLTDGADIPLSRTSIPLPVDRLLGNLNGLVASVPRAALASTLTGLAKGFGGAAPDLAHILDQSNAVLDTSLRNLNDQIGLINTLSPVLDTQVDKAPRIATLSAELAGFTDVLRGLNPTFAELFNHGSRAAEEFSGLVADNDKALPELLDNLNTVAGVAADHRPQLHKTLATAPWAFQSVLDAIRYCSENDPRTGQPVPGTCEYDAAGRPRYSLRFALQLIEKPLVSSGYQPCIRGYDGTRRFLPNGVPADGVGPNEAPEAAPNNAARCAVPPTDPGTPNVRGAQNAERGGG